MINVPLVSMKIFSDSHSNCARAREILLLIFIDEVNFHQENCSFPNQNVTTAYLEGQVRIIVTLVTQVMNGLGIKIFICIIFHLVDGICANHVRVVALRTSETPAKIWNVVHLPRPMKKFIVAFIGPFVLIPENLIRIITNAYSPLRTYGLIAVNKYIYLLKLHLV